jgi:REP element-mobilizing transposase RayT
VCKVFISGGKMDVYIITSLDHFRRKSMLRRKKWDYGDNSTYLITINTFKRRPHFGHLTAAGVMLSDIGIIAEDRLMATHEIFPHVRLSEWVIMPDHIHVIVHFRKWGRESSVPGSFGPQKGTLGSVIRGFKAGVTSRAKEICPQFKW